MFLLSPIVFIAIGTLGVILFHMDVYFPIGLSVAILIGVSWFFMHRYRTNRIGLLALLLWLVYALPFIHISPYLWFDFNSDPLLLWGLAVNPYMTNKRIISLTAMLGAMGGLGMAFGASLLIRRVKLDHGLETDGARRTIRTLSFQIWLIWVLIGFALSWLSAPEQTVFAAAYTESKAALEGKGFDSAWMLSYVILSYAFCDALLDCSARTASLKRKVIFSVVAFIVFVLQLLRGDRESIPWVFGLALVSYYWAAGITQRRGYKIPWGKIGVLTITLLVVSMVVGVLRSQLTGQDLFAFFGLVFDLFQSEAFDFSSFLSGTWSAVLLTPLSVAGDYINNLLQNKWGKDYFDLILSMPPGFVADAIGYVRPINAEVGPAWEMRYGIGGTHASVLPFMNFLMAGVFLIPAAWMYILCSFEKSAMSKISAINLSLLVTMVMAAPHWLWYGEKAGLNAFVMWVILSFVYRMSKGLFKPREKNAIMGPCRANG